MKFRDLIRIIFIFSGIFLAYYITFYYSQKNKYQIQSPDGALRLDFKLSDKGEPLYTLYFKEKKIIEASRLGLNLKFDYDLAADFKIESAEYASQDTVWQPVWGEYAQIASRYNEMLITLVEKKPNARRMQLVFRLANDGLALRYLIPEQRFLQQIKVAEENTEFVLPHDMYAWWIPMNYNSDEMLYNTSFLSAVDSIIRYNKCKAADELYMENPVQGRVGFNTPLTLCYNDEYFLAFHEAALTDYSEMKLSLERKNPKKYILKSVLVPHASGDVSYKVQAALPFASPWRVVLFAKNEKELLQSTFILNLNEPNRISDAESWCNPINYMGIWWGYHTGKYSWDPGHETLPHGATTENAKKYIDFCAENQIKGLLIEGWCGFLDKDSTQVGVAGSTFKSGLRDYTKPHPDFDFEAVVRYAQSRGVEIIVHNETMGEVENYEAQLEKAFAYYASLGIHYVKTGYAWYIENKKYHHHEQRMVQHFQKVIETAAQYRINLITHESNKDTGIRRTYPNMMTRESVRGNEYNAWVKSAGNPPEHEVILPFTRGLAGPIDFTPGIFDLKFGKVNPKSRIHTTKAKQLSLYVVFYSPITMLADFPENYEMDMESFAFLKSVPTTWDDTRVLDARIGDYVVLARRKGDTWYVGGCTDERARTLQVSFDFLDKNTSYSASLYTDAEDTDLSQTPERIKIEHNLTISSNSKFEIPLKSSGGFAMRIQKVD